MYRKIQITLPVNYYLLFIGDKSLGEFERSQLRNIIEVIDNAI